MKKVVLYIVSALLIGALVLAVGNKSHQAASQEEAGELKQTAELNTTRENYLKQRTLSTSLTRQYNQLHAECEKGVAAYAKLPVASKTTTPAPTCGAALLE